MDHSPVYRSGGPCGVFAVRAEFVPGAKAALHLHVEHSDSRREAWSVAGTFAAVTASGTSAVQIAGIKELYRLAWEFVASPRDSARVHFLEPAWSPQPPDQRDQEGKDTDMGHPEGDTR